MSNNLNKFNSLYDLKFKYLQSISCERTIDSISDTDGSYKITLILSQYNHVYPKSIIMCFLGATNIKIGDINGMLGMLVNIKNVSTDGLDNINYIVHESEYDTFSFMCKEFTIELVPN